MKPVQQDELPQEAKEKIDALIRKYGYEACLRTLEKVIQKEKQKKATEN